MKTYLDIQSLHHPRTLLGRNIWKFRLHWRNERFFHMVIGHIRCSQHILLTEHLHQNLQDSRSDDRLQGLYIELLGHKIQDINIHWHQRIHRMDFPRNLRHTNMCDCLASCDSLREFHKRLVSHIRRCRYKVLHHRLESQACTCMQNERANYSTQRFQHNVLQSKGLDTRRYLRLNVVLECFCH